MVCPINCAALLAEVCELIDNCCGNIPPLTAQTIQTKLLLCIASSAGGSGGSSCLSPLFVEVCNDIEVTLDNGSSCGDPLFANICSSVLPTGAATSANQVTELALLVSIDGKTPALGQALMAASTPVVIASNQSAIAVTAASLPLPAGAATEVTLAAINTKILPAGQAVMASSSPVVIASNQTAVPISAASLPLPTGAATAALQTQPGVDIGDVTVNNAAGAAAVNIQDGGNSITVDAVSLPLPTGASTSALQTTGNTSLSSIDTKTLAAGQALMAASSPVVIASNQSAISVTLAANQSVNMAQVAGTATSVNNGTSDAGTQRVTLASNSTGQVALAAGAAIIGSLAANQSTNVAQINGVTPLMGAGNTGTGSLRVTIATDQAAFTTPMPVNQTQMNGVAVSSGTGASGTGVQRTVLTDDSLSTAKISGLTANGATGTFTNPVLGGSVARNTSPAVVTQDQLVRFFSTLAGAQIIQPFGAPGDFVYRSLIYGDYTAGAGTDVLVAPGANLRLVVTSITVSNGDTAVANSAVLYDGTITNPTVVERFSSKTGAADVTKTYPGGLWLGTNLPLKVITGAAGTAGMSITAHGYKVPA